MNFSTLDIHPVIPGLLIANKNSRKGSQNVKTNNQQYLHGYFNWQNYNTRHPLNIIMVPYGDDSILSWWHIVMT